MSQEDMNAALDALEKEHGIANDEAVQEDYEVDEPEQEVAEDVEPEEAVKEEEVKGEDKEDPPGFVSYEEWISQGKDPDDYKGKNAFKAEYGRIQEIKELKESMKAITSGLDDWKQMQQEQMMEKVEAAKAEAEERLRKAKEDMDVDAALKAQNDLYDIELKDSKRQEQVNSGIHPAILEYCEKNPIINKGSSQFDQEFFNDMSMIQQSIVDQLTGGNEQRGAQLTPAQLTRSMNVAYSRTKELHADKFVSKRNSRQAAPPAPTRRATANKSEDYGAKLKSFKMDSKNKQNQGAAYEFYEELKKKNPKAAETYAKNVLGA